MIKAFKEYIQAIKRKRALKLYMTWKQTKILPLP